MKNEELEKHLMKQLSGSGLETTSLKSFSSQIAKSLQNVALQRVYLKGQPRPDTVVAETTLPISELAGLKDLLSSELIKLIVHPIGVPVLKEINVQAHFSLNGLNNESF